MIKLEVFELNDLFLIISILFRKKFKSSKKTKSTKIKHKYLICLEKSFLLI